MNCSELELHLCDYLDGTLDAARHAAIDRHLQTCAACTELVHDCSSVIAFTRGLPEVEPPAAMVTRILQQIPASQPAVERPKGWMASLLGRWLEPVLQPRLVMGMAMTILSFAMLGRFAGIEARQLRPADISPVRVYEAAEDRLHRTWLQAVKYYESLRFVYEIQSRLRDLTEPEEDADPKPLDPNEPGAKSNDGGMKK